MYCPSRLTLYLAEGSELKLKAKDRCPCAISVPILCFGTLLFCLGLALLPKTYAFEEEASWQGDRIPLTSFRVIAESVADRSEASGRGLYWELLKAVYEPLDIQLKITTAARKQARTLVSRYREYLAIAGEYRDAPVHLRYPRYPLEEEILTVLALKHRVPATTLHSLEQWQGLNVSWLRDKDLITPSEYGFQLQEHDSFTEGMELLYSQLTDLIIAKKHLIQQFLLSNESRAREFHLAAFPQTKSVYLGFQPGSVSEALIEMYNRRIESLAQQGKLQPLYNRWQAKVPRMIQGLTQFK